MIIIYRLVLLSISTITLGMETSKPTPPSAHITHYELESSTHFPPAKTTRIVLTEAERNIFLNAKKRVKHKPSASGNPTAKQLEAPNKSSMSLKTAHEILELSGKLQQQYGLAVGNLQELIIINTHLNVLGTNLLPLSYDWQTDSLALFTQIQSLIPRLTITIYNCDQELDNENPRTCDAAAILLRNTLLAKITNLNFEYHAYKDMLKKQLNDSTANVLEPLTSTQQIKKIVTATRSKSNFIETALLTLTDHYESYIKVNKAVTSLQKLLKTDKIFCQVEESKRFHILSVLKRLRPGLAQEARVPVIKDITDLPVYNKEVHACNVQQIQNIRKTYQYSIKFRIEDPLVSSDRECKSEILYFFSKEELLNQHELIEQINPTTSFKFKTNATPYGFCVANKDLRVKMISESLWYIGQDYYFIDHTKGPNLYKVNLVAALNLPEQKSTPTKI